MKGFGPEVASRERSSAVKAASRILHTSGDVVVNAQDITLSRVLRLGTHHRAPCKGSAPAGVRCIAEQREHRRTNADHVTGNPEQWVVVRRRSLPQLSVADPIERLGEKGGVGSEDQGKWTCRWCLHYQPPVCREGYFDCARHRQRSAQDQADAHLTRLKCSVTRPWLWWRGESDDGTASCGDSGRANGRRTSRGRPGQDRRQPT